MWTGEAFARVACHVPLQVRPVAKPGHNKHFSFSYFGYTIAQMTQLFVFQTHKMCYKYVVCIIFTSDRILRRQTLVLHCALAPGAVSTMQMLTTYLHQRFRFRQLAHSEHLLFQKSKIKPVSTAPWFWKRSHRRRKAPPRYTSRARVACEASSLPCCCCRLSSLRC